MEVDNRVTSVSWSPDGSEIVLVAERTVVVWNVVTQAIVTTIEVEAGQPDHWREPGRRTVAKLHSSRAGTVVVWNVITTTLVTTIEIEAGDRVTGVSWSPDSSQVALITGQTVVIWNVVTEVMVTVVEIDAGNRVTSVTWSADGEEVALVTRRTVVIWNVVTSTTCHDH